MGSDRLSRRWFAAIAPPMLEKPIISQVGPLSAWSAGCVGPGARRLGGV